MTEQLSNIQWWGIAAGIGFFLFGLHQVETALTVLAGRRFKLFIRRNTSRPIKSVFTGTVATAVLQSSSVVGLTVLAFVGAGLVSMRNALGVIFGSNLGTTFTGWLVVTLGFKLALDEAALPLVAVGILMFMTFRDAGRIASAGRILAGAGMVLLGLEYMKSGVADFSANIDLANYQGLPLIAFLALGAILTAIIQSSSAMMMIALSALYGGVLNLEQAAAVAIGADLGTTVTVLLGSLGGTAAKKRVALAHLLFNAGTDAVAFILLKPLLLFLTAIVGISDPLYVLVAFHSLFNALGIVFFLPMIGRFALFLERRFKTDESEQSTRYISRVEGDLPEVALEALRKESEFLVQQAVSLNRKAIGIADRKRADAERMFVVENSFEQGYEHIKRLEGEILEFSVAIQQQKLDKELADRLTQSLSAVRNAVHATKSIKDVKHDLETFDRSVSDYLAGFRSRLKKDIGAFYDSFEQTAAMDYPGAVASSLLDLISENNRLHDELHEAIRQEAMSHDLSQTELSTLLNVNRELYISNRDLVLALKDCKLPPRLADEVMGLPGVA